MYLGTVAGLVFLPAVLIAAVLASSRCQSDLYQLIIGQLPADLGQDPGSTLVVHLARPAARPIGRYAHDEEEEFPLSGTHAALGTLTHSVFFGVWTGSQ